MPKKSSGSVADTNRASYSEYEVEEFTIYEKDLEKLLSPLYLKKMIRLHKNYLERHKIF